MAGIKLSLDLVKDGVTPDLKGLEKKINKSIGIAMMRIGMESQAKARGLAPYKSGTLRRGIQYQAKAKSVEFGVNGSIIPYARIREFGGTIRAKNKPYLHFKIGGRWVRVKEVKQKASNSGRGYLRPTFSYMRTGRAGSILNEEIKNIL